MRAAEQLSSTQQGPLPENRDASTYSTPAGSPPSSPFLTATNPTDPPPLSLSSNYHPTSTFDAPPSSASSQYDPTHHATLLNPPLSSDMRIPSYPGKRGSPTHCEPLEIILASDFLVCRGVSGNLEPALLSGHVVLNLHEATNIKDIVLELSCKAKIPTTDPRTTQPSSMHALNPVLYTHSWSFLPGDGHSKHTIKAGRHTFPFQHELQASLPASTEVLPLSASIEYKLHATAIRSAFSANYHSTKSFSLLKSFSSEALEYNQSPEVENTWPGKIMYSIMIPHKAYAAGDSIPALLRFTPTAKGVSVLSVNMELKEFVTVRWRYQQDLNASRTVANVKYQVTNGKAVRSSWNGLVHPPSTESSSLGGSHPQSAEVSTSTTPMTLSDPEVIGSSSGAPPLERSDRISSSSRSTSLKNLINLVGSHHTHQPRSEAEMAPPSARSSAAAAVGPPHHNHHAVFSLGPSRFSSPTATPNISRRPSREDVRYPESIRDPSPNDVSRMDASAQTGSQQLSQPGPSNSASTNSWAPDTSDTPPAPSTPPQPSDADATIPPSGDDELNTKIHLKIPVSTSATHTSSTSTNISADQRYPFPISISHKVRFSIVLSNLDGHTSELRCALPVHILDSRLKREARAATRITREVLLGRPRRRRRGGESARGRTGGRVGFVIGDPEDTVDAESEEGREGLSMTDEDDEYEYDDDEDDEQPVELPSYNSHVHDRVANAEIGYSQNFGSDGRSFYAPNSLAGFMSVPGVSPGLISSGGSGYFSAPASSAANGHLVGNPSHASGHSSPATGGSHPSSPGVAGHRSSTNNGGDPLAFEEELMLSLGEVAATSAPPSSSYTSGSSSIFPRFPGAGFRSAGSSRAQSRSNSRAPSPEPHHHERDSGDGPAPSSISASSARSHHSIFHLPAALKPLSALSGLRPHGHGHRTTGTTTPTTHHSPSTSVSNQHHNIRRSQSRPSSPTMGHRSLPLTSSPSHPPSTTTPLSHPHITPPFDRLVQVPSYEISSRGFLGGGAPPLQLYRDLPTYDEASSQRPSPEDSPSNSTTNVTQSQSDNHIASS